MFGCPPQVLRVKLHEHLLLGFILVQRFQRDTVRNLSIGVEKTFIACLVHLGQTSAGLVGCVQNKLRWLVILDYRSDFSLFGLKQLSATPVLPEIVARSP